MKKTIIFDLDGTLTDSGEGIKNCAGKTLEHFHLPVENRDALGFFVGPPLAESFLKFGVQEDMVEEAIQVFRVYYQAGGKYENYPYPGVMELLKALKDNGHQLYIATAKAEPLALDILEHFEMAQYFDQICGASMDSSRTTKEAVLEYLLSNIDTKENLVMVGDSIYDILGAKYHNIPAIGVSWGYGNVQEMTDAGAMTVVDSTEQLLTLLNA